MGCCYLHEGVRDVGIERMATREVLSMYLCMMEGGREEIGWMHLCCMYACRNPRERVEYFCPLLIQFREGIKEE